jgi:hypothetical protein
MSTHDFEENYKMISNAQQLIKGTSDASCSDGRWDKEVQRGIFGGACRYCKKMGHKLKDHLETAKCQARRS